MSEDCVLSLYASLYAAGMDWLCPGYSEVLAKQLDLYHGNVTALNTIRDIVSIVQTGDLHVAVYDLSHELLYVANARGDSEQGPVYAYDRYCRTNSLSVYFYAFCQDFPAAESD